MNEKRLKSIELQLTNLEKQKKTLIFERVRQP